MGVNNRPADGLGIEHACVTAQVAADPCSERAFQNFIAFGMDVPIVKHALRRGLTRCVTYPSDAAIDNGGVRRNMSAREHRHPHVSGRGITSVVGDVTEKAAAGTHAAKVKYGFGENGEAWWHEPVRSGIKTLAQRKTQF